VLSTYWDSPGASDAKTVSPVEDRVGVLDINTRHRRFWANRYLPAYLKARWQGDLREAARLHSQVIAEKGKPSTAKQFAPNAAVATNRWFGGDMSALYAAVGEKSTVRPIRVSLVPADRIGFVERVFKDLGGPR
jgi:hypothetical protein